MATDAMVSALVLLGAGIAGVGLARAARLTPLIGFFISGAIVGPHGLGWVGESGSVHFLAEIGVAFFLFEVGLYLPLKKIAQSWRSFFLLGPVQVVSCSIGLALLTRLLGLGWTASVLVGVTLSLSSTAVVLRVLQDHGELSTPVGQGITSILVFQDLVAVGLLALIAALGQPDTGAKEILFTFGKMTVGLVAVVGIGRWLLNPFLGWVVRLEAGEIVTGAALFAVLSLAWFGSHAGLSIALGAFLAGVCLAESRYAYLVQSEISTFRILLLSLFFLSVGLELDPRYIVTNLPKLLAISIGVMVAKAVLSTISQLLSGAELSPSFRSGALLSQGSEFAFIVAAAGLAGGLLTDATVQLLATVVPITLALTPLAGWASCVLSRKLARGSVDPAAQDPGPREVVIVQFDEFAWKLAAILTRASIPYRGHDNDWSRILLARSRGYEVHFSDMARPRTLSRASVGLVRAVVLLADDHIVAERLVSGLTILEVKLPILAATKDMTLFEQLQEKGLTAVFVKNEESTEILAARLLEELHVAAKVIEGAIPCPEATQAARAA